jgi:O-methyltransferase
MRNAADLYLTLMKKSLLDTIYDPERKERLIEGTDWPKRAHSMLSEARMDNVRFCVESVLANGVPGDLMETGVWRGGATIFMRAILEAYGDAERRVWVADSFRGLPPPDAAYPADSGDRLFEHPELAVRARTVRENFRRYDLLDERVVFVQGWFRDTLPACAVERLAVLRLDGDMYESTYIALEALYAKVSPGGFLIVDDYGVLESCRRAVHDFRDAKGITEPIVAIDWTGAYWQRAV